MLWLTLIGILAIAMVLSWATRRPAPVVIGQQFAAALSNERARLAAGQPGLSPMPPEGYDVERGECSLTKVLPLELDSKLIALTKQFTDRDMEARQNTRATISLEQQYTLLRFASRCALLAVFQRDGGWCGAGLLALAMIDETRIDPRDADLPACLLGYAIGSIAVDGSRLVDSAATLATPAMSRLMNRARTAWSLSDCGFIQVQTAKGELGVIRLGSSPYSPTFDMSKLALEIATWLQSGRYTAEPELAATLPSVWFAKQHRKDADDLLANACAAISITGKLRRALATDSSSQMFFAWVLEMRNEQDASLLTSCVGPRPPLDGRYAASIVSGRLFLIFVAGSLRQGVAPFETQETLAVLAEGARPILDVAIRSV
jgi:hypothetical protein